MFKMCPSNSHSYTHLILALDIVREPTVWWYITPNILAYMKLAGLTTASIRVPSFSTLDTSSGRYIPAYAMVF